MAYKRSENLPTCYKSNCLEYVYRGNLWLHVYLPSILRCLLGKLIPRYRILPFELMFAQLVKLSLIFMGPKFCFIFYYGHT